ncbi:MAG: hypothetical protein CM1200mP26_07800 [Acidimicrobiales bacterium]|nr:MAG: hypothetical protein CM1200mP26_07800 [Acidimicrobiales bacterium]
MEPYCDFTEQVTAQNLAGDRIRPDVKVRLPNGAQLFVDAKVPLDAYLRAQEATDQTVVDAELKAHPEGSGDARQGSGREEVLGGRR